MAVHPRYWLKGETISRPEHENGLLEQKPGAQQSADLQAIKALGQNAARYVDLIPAQTTSIRSELSRLMALITVYGAKAMEETIGKALARGVVGALHLERLLMLKESAAAIKNPEPLSLSDPRLSVPPSVPDLKSYDVILMQSEPGKEEENADPARTTEKPEA